MFDTALNLWLQARATPELTTAMSVVSLIGSFPGSVAIASVWAFGWRLREGVRLLLTLAVAAVLTTAVKASVGAPRPDLADARVQTLGGIQGVRYDAARIRAMEDPLGFPSGHTAAAVTLMLGGARIFGWRWLLAAGCVWIPLTALSRLYLGRHFPGDVLGGLGVGLAVVLLSAPIWRALPAASDGSFRRWDPMHGAAALGLAILALDTNVVRAIDAGRLLGFAAAAAVLFRRDALWAVPSWPRRLFRILLSLVMAGLTVGWSVWPSGLAAGDDVLDRAAWLTGAVILHAALVLAPVFTVPAASEAPSVNP